MTPPFSLARRRLWTDALDGAGVASLFATTAAASATPASDDGLHDFDLFPGTWRARHRKLKKRLAGSDDWAEFEGTQWFLPMLGGAGNMDDNVFDVPGAPYRGVSLRDFDPKTRTWAIWWLDSRVPHKIDVPVIGRFENGVGTFLADDTFEGRPIRMRFLWSKITARSRYWEQAFSPDGGKTWETNWTTEFEKIS
ncbi:MAG TPA: hypothetical protein VJ806_05005 [Luteimonas sp.]|nr:hypothetical protein [Luteimonas sp.]